MWIYFPLLLKWQTNFNLLGCRNTPSFVKCNFWSFTIINKVLVTLFSVRIHSSGKFWIGYSKKYLNGLFHKSCDLEDTKSNWSRSCKPSYMLRPTEFPSTRLFHIKEDNGFLNFVTFSGLIKCTCIDKGYGEKKPHMYIKVHWHNYKIWLGENPHISSSALA